MNPFAVILAICSLATSQARPGWGHGGEHMPLEGVPNESHYSKLTYPKLDVISLGSAIKDTLPPAVVTINKKVIIKEPKPYPVKVPYPVPHPVEVAKPYPVIETKIIKVPHPVPVEVIKKVPLPIEIPKPYPVPTEEFKAPHLEAPVASYGGSFSGQHQLNEVQEESQEGGLGGGFEGGYGGGFGGGYDGGFEGGDNSEGGYAEADQSQNYGSQVQQSAENVGWVPLGHGGGEAQQVAEHQ